MAKHINTFKNGLNFDVNENSYPNTCYPEAYNLRIMAESNQDSATLTNIRDDKVISRLTDYVIVGRIILGEKLVLFLRHITIADRGKILSIPLEHINFPTFNINNLSYRVIECPNFNFADNVAIVGVYENDITQNVYFIDNNNVLRVVNIYQSYETDQDASILNVTKPALMEKIELHKIVDGKLKTGTYQYAYCFFKRGGGETIYSSGTTPIYLSASSLTEGNSSQFRGSVSGENSGKGLNIITWVDPKMLEYYDNIRFVRMYYSSQNSIPEITVVYEGPYSLGVDHSVIITDTGGVSLGSITIEEYRYFPILFNATTLEVKNNYLLAANIKEQSFDLDPNKDVYLHTFRFTSSSGQAPVARLYLNPPQNINQVEDYLIIGSNISDNVLDGMKDLNYVQSTNIISLDSLADKNPEFKANRQADGITVGGEGGWIKYKFVTRQRKALQSLPFSNGSFGKIGTNYRADLYGYDDMTNPMVVQSNLGYQRSEIYRFGIVFFDAYGRHSFVKWIGDIRFPEEKDGFPIVTIQGYEYIINDLLIEFTFKQEFLQYLRSNEINRYQIVRAERTYDDATVKDCGYGASIETSPFSNSVVTRNILHEFRTNTFKYNIDYICPETYVNKNNYKAYDRIDMYPGFLTCNAKVHNSAKIFRNDYLLLIAYPYNTTNNFNRYRVNDKIAKIDYNEKVKTTSLSNFGTHVGKGFSNRFMSWRRDPSGNFSYTGGEHNISLAGTTMILDLEDAWYDDYYDYYLGKTAYIRRRSYSYPYGGYTKQAIHSTTYYPVTGIRVIFDTDPISFTCGNGDCFIEWFEYLRGVWTIEKDALGTGEGDHYRKGGQTFLGLVESKINPRFMVNPTISILEDGAVIESDDRTSLIKSEYKYLAMREQKGAYPLDSDKTIIFEQDFDLYTYNPVYSQMDKSKVYFMRPDGLQDINTFPSRIYRTNKKINGENTDSWSKFYANNFLDIDSRYGPITKLINFNNKIFAFQPKGIAFINIEEREMIPNTEGNSIMVGSGGVMNTFQYITTSSGASHQDGILVTPYSIYYVDDKNKKLATLEEHPVFISDLKGIKSFCSNKNFDTVYLVYDPRFNEVWWKIDDETLLFNAYFNTFVSKINNNTFSYPTYFDGNLYIFDNKMTMVNVEGDNTFLPCSLSIIVNPNSVITNRYDSIVVSSEVTDFNGKVFPDISFDAVEFSNSYQEFASTPFTSSSRIRFRRFILNTIRDIHKHRVYSPYLKATFNFTTGEAEERGMYKIKIHDIITNYEPINAR